jgi:HSP20 family protein
MRPFSGRGFYDPHSEMNRLFDEMFGGLSSSSSRSGGQQRGQGVAEWAPAIDAVQKDDDLVVRAELPGAKPEDVEVTVHQGVLTISGKREEQREEERGEYLVRERRSGSFRRSLQLPEGIDENSIRARFDNGVLEVTVEGAAAAQGPKRIQLEGS